MRELTVRIAGRGGQGIVLAGKILGTAIAKIGKEVMYTQEYGSRARGGVVYADLIISDEEVNEILFEQADILVTMSQESFDTQKEILRRDGTLVVNSGLVEFEPNSDWKVETVPFTSLALTAGNKKTANMAMLAYLNEKHDIVPSETLKDAMLKNVSALIEENKESFERGRERANKSNS